MCIHGCSGGVALGHTYTLKKVSGIFPLRKNIPTGDQVTVIPRK